MCARTEAFCAPALVRVHTRCILIKHTECVACPLLCGYVTPFVYQPHLFRVVAKHSVRVSVHNALSYINC